MTRGINDHYKYEKKERRKNTIINTLFSTNFRTVYQFLTDIVAANLNTCHHEYKEIFEVVCVKLGKLSLEDRWKQKHGSIKDKHSYKPTEGESPSTSRIFLVHQVYK
jgi:hypothetical protein